MMCDNPLPRGTYLGGHQIGAVVGLHPYLSMHEVFAHCALGISPATPKAKATLFRRGHIVEEGLRLDTEEAYGVAIVPKTFWVDDEQPFIAGSPDGLTWGADGAPEMLWEFTSTTSRQLGIMWGEDGDESGAALYKLLQVQWYLGLTGFPRAMIVLWIADTGETRYYPVERNDMLIERLREVADWFWCEHILTKTVPDAEECAAGWEAVGRGVDLCYFGTLDPMTNPPPALIEAAHAYGVWRDIESHAEEQKKELAAQIKAIVADHRGAKWPASDGGVDDDGVEHPATTGGAIVYTPKKPSDEFDAAAAFDELVGICDDADGAIALIRKKHTTRAPHPGRTFQVRLTSKKKSKA